MKGKYSLSGIGLGVYLITLGFALLVSQFSSTDYPYLATVFRLYPLPLILLGIEYLIKPGGSFRSRPDSLVVTLIIVITVLGLLNNFIPYSFIRGPHIHRIIDMRHLTITSKRVRDIEEVKTIEKKYPLPADINTVYIKNTFGDINISEGKAGEVSLTAEMTLRARSREALEAYRSEYQVSGQVEGDRFVLKIERPPSRGNFPVPQAAVDWTVSIPAGVAVEIKNSFGDIKVADIRGDLQLININGELEAGLILGNASIENRFGDVNIEEVEGKLEADIKNGDIQVKKVAGDVWLENSFGKIEFDLIEGNLKIRAANSRIDIEEVTGDVDLQNSFDRVRIKKCGGSVDIHLNNGDLKLASTKIGGIYNIEVKFGDVELDLPENAGFALMAHTSHGEIRSDYPIKVREEMLDKTAEGEINGGGPEIRIEIQNGNINIR